MFAALVPLCMALNLGHPSWADALCCPASVGSEGCCPPVWAYHGANDVRASVAHSDDWVAALRAQLQRPASQEVRYSRFDAAPPLSGVWEGHDVGAIAYHDEALWSWLMAQECPTCTGPPEPEQPAEPPERLRAGSLA